MEQAEHYAGFMVYRNGLRVMPYGRKTMTSLKLKSEGPQRWPRVLVQPTPLRRVALTRELNPNLKDKAGREGIIDNKAAKAFRDIVENILMVTQGGTLDQRLRFAKNSCRYQGSA